MTQRSYKFRIYPTHTQKEQLSKYFGQVRFVWNYCLSLRNDLYEVRKERINYVGLNKHITYLKTTNKYSWLKECPSACLTQVLINQDTAYKNFYEKGSGYPKFKKKQSKQSIRFQLDQKHIHNIYKSGELLKLPKLGSIKVKWSRIPNGIPKMATLTKDSLDKYYISFSCDEVIPTKAKTKQSVGIDIGIKDVVVTSDGYHSGSPKYTYKYAKALKIAQRKLSRKKKGSNRYNKQRIKVAKIHSKIVNCRKDFLHKLTTDLVTKYDVICIENLNVSGMMKNRKLSKAVADIGMFELRRQLEYKANWYGKKVQVIDRWFPSSKTCSSCGQIHSMPLSKRTMECDCGNTLDRDENAARNILSLGMEKFKTYAESDTNLVLSTRQTMKRSSKIKMDGVCGTHHTA